MDSRTCIGCRRPDQASNLLRLVWDDARATVVIDERRILPGRGAWIHDQPRCRDQAVKRRALTRALRRTVPSDSVPQAIGEPGPDAPIEP